MKRKNKTYTSIFGLFFYNQIIPSKRQQDKKLFNCNKNREGKQHFYNTQIEKVNEEPLVWCSFYVNTL